MLSETRRQSILERIGGLLRHIDPDVSLHDVLVDSTRQQLIIVLQKGEFPILLGMSYLDYVSHRDEELSNNLRKRLHERLQAARLREMEE